MFSKQSTNVKSIHYLRGVAAIAVLYFHSSESYGLNFNVGAAGVDVFFVISGFVVWITTAKHPISPSAFLRRRIIRIVPLYWVVTVVTAVALVWKPAFFDNQSIDSIILFRSLMFLPEITCGAFQPVALQGWTLTYEMMFYLSFSLILSMPYNTRLLYNALIFVGLVVIGTVSPTEYLHTLASPLILEFVAGTFIAAAWLAGRHAPIPVSIAACLIGISWFAVMNTGPSDLNRLIRWGVPSVMIVAALVSIEGALSMRRIALLEFLGDASFSIYLWQGIAGKMATGFLLKLNLPDFLMPLSVVVLTLTMTIIAYVILEKPMQIVLRKNFDTRVAGAPLFGQKTL